MKVFDAPRDTDPAVLMLCDCGEKFWVDPCTEENLIFEHGRLIEKCPKCGKINDEEEI